MLPMAVFVEASLAIGWIFLLAVHLEVNFARANTAR